MNTELDVYFRIFLKTCKIRNMKHYSFSEMNRTTGEILEQALKGPVTLTKRGKDKLVVMPVETFQRLSGRHQIQAYSIDDMPADVAADLEAALKQAMRDLSEDGR